MQDKRVIEFYWETFKFYTFYNLSAAVAAIRNNQ